MSRQSTSKARNEPSPTLERLISVMMDHKPERARGKASKTDVAKILKSLKRYVGKYPKEEFEEYLIPALIAMEPLAHHPAMIIQDIVKYAKLMPAENLSEYYHILGTALTSKVAMTYANLDTYIVYRRSIDTDPRLTLDRDFKKKVKSRNLRYNDLGSLDEDGKVFYFKRDGIEDWMLIPLRRKFVFHNINIPTQKDRDIIARLSVHLPEQMYQKKS